MCLNSDHNCNIAAETMKIYHINEEENKEMRNHLNKDFQNYLASKTASKYMLDEAVFI